MAVGTYFKMDLANALRAQMADGAVVFRRGKVVAIEMDLSLTPPLEAGTNKWGFQRGPSIPFGQGRG